MIGSEEDFMAENDSQKLPSFSSIDELVEFFDVNDMGEYEEELPDEHFEVDVQRKDDTEIADNSPQSQK